MNGMQFEQSSFTVGGDTSEAYRENYDRIFGKRPLPGVENAPEPKNEPFGHFCKAKECWRANVPQTDCRLCVDWTMVPCVPLYCPHCSARHIDRGEWSTRPHHKHLCASCGKLWRVEPYVFGAARIMVPKRSRPSG